MPHSFSKRGSAICTGSAEVTEGCHMRFAEYATRISALLQEDGMGRVRPALEAISLPQLCCHYCPSQTQRVFSVVKTIATASRSDLGQDTICAWLSCMLNTEDSCVQCQPSDELLKSAKSATWRYVKADPSHE